MVVCGTFTNFLDLECLFVNVFSGGITIFLFVASIAYLALASALRMPLGAIGAGFILLGVILAPISDLLLVIGLVFGSIAIGLSLARVWR